MGFFEGFYIGMVFAPLGASCIAQKILEMLLYNFAGMAFGGSLFIE